MVGSNISRSDVESYIWKVNDKQELHDLNKILVQRMRNLEARVASTFSVGDRVTWNSRKGFPVTGRITKINLKSIKVKTDENLIGVSTNWIVSPSLLRKVI